MNYNYLYGIFLIVNNRICNPVCFVDQILHLTPAESHHRKASKKFGAFLFLYSSGLKTLLKTVK